MPRISPEEAFRKFVPLTTVSYCAKLWYDNNFDLKITPKRSTKLGDYKYDFLKKRHTISVNHDLNRYGFLITYLHEIAHLKTFKKYSTRVLPHGIEWKIEFQKLVEPILNKETFPDKIFYALSKYMSNPKASSCSDSNLSLAIRSFDEIRAEISLIELRQGEKFYFNNRLFVKEELKRTRYICTEEKTGKRYLIPKVALVKKLQS